MKVLGQPVALIVAAALLLLLAISDPLFWLHARNAAASATTGEQSRPNPVAQYVAMLSESEPLRAALRDHEVIGYVSESDVDVRGDSSDQAARYYLSQFAVAPVLVELGSSSEQRAPDRALVLAAFRLPQQLAEFLGEDERSAVVSLNANIALTRARER